MRPFLRLQGMGLAAMLILWGNTVAFGQRSSFPSGGDLLPSVRVYDEAGQPFSTDQLRGQYTVLVFGCLT